MINRGAQLSWLLAATLVAFGKVALASDNFKIGLVLPMAGQ
jgi:hypothetical protein